VLRAITVAGLAVVLVAAAASGAVLLLFTSPVFDLLGFHPVALDYFHGRVTRPELHGMAIIGRSFGEAEIGHLDDVAAILALVFRLFLAAVALILLAALRAPARLRSAATAALSAIVVTGAAIVAAYFAFGFEAVGVFFHRIVFPAGNWRFPADSLIIRLYGTDVMVTGTLFGIVAAVSLLVAAFVATRFIAAGRDGAGDSARRSG